jgi:hypothetical protein
MDTPFSLPKRRVIRKKTFRHSAAEPSPELIPLFQTPDNGTIYREILISYCNRL